MQNTVAGRTVTYNFRANDVVITESGTVTSSNTYSYSVVYENYKDPKTRIRSRMLFILEQINLY